VTAGKLVEAPVILNAGTLALSAVMAEGADPAPDGLSWDIYGEADAEGERKKAAYSYDAQPKSRLKAGKYLVTVKRGAVFAKAEVEVAAGKMTTQVVNLNAGTLKLDSNTGGGWDIFGPQDAEGNRKKLSFSYDKQFKVAMPVGKALVVRTDGQKKAQQEVEIKANTLSELTLDAK
jgi:hypothetical protein